MMQKRGRPPHPDVLTPREFEVLALVRERLTNEQIASRLGISPDTAKYHVSEIITKLGVASRQEAARWQPEAEPRRAWMFALPAGILRRLHAIPHIAGGAIVITVVAAIGVLAWGVASARSDGTAHDARLGAAGATAPTRVVAWSVDDTDRGVASVMMFDLERREARRLPLPADVGFAEWVKAGVTFVAFDRTSQGYNLYDAAGALVKPILGEPLTTGVTASSDGASLLLVSGADHSLRTLDVASGTTALLYNDIVHDAALSPAGSRIAFTWVGLHDTEGTPHPDWSSLYVLDPTPNSVCCGAIAGEQGADTYLQFAYDPWSPDGQYLIAESGTIGGACINGCGGAPSQNFEVLDMTGRVIWHTDLLRSRWVRWAGPDRIFVDEPAATLDTGSVLPASRKIVDLAQGITIDAPAALTGFPSFSPDGRYAIARDFTPGQPSGRCKLLDAATGDEIARFSCRWSAILSGGNWLAIVSFYEGDNHVESEGTGTSTGAQLGVGWAVSVAARSGAGGPQRTPGAAVETALSTGWAGCAGAW